MAYVMLAGLGPSLFTHVKRAWARVAEAESDGSEGPAEAGSVYHAACFQPLLELRNHTTHHSQSDSGWSRRAYDSKIESFWE